MSEASPRESIEREIARAGMVGDPMEPTLRLLLRAVERIETAEANLRQPISPEARSEAVARISEEAAAALRAEIGAMTHAWRTDERSRDRRGIAVALASVLVALCAAFGSGWWLAASQPVATALGPLPPGLVAAMGMTNLQSVWQGRETIPQMGGGEAARILLWTRHPAPSERNGVIAR